MARKNILDLPVPDFKAEDIVFVRDLGRGVKEVELLGGIAFNCKMKSLSEAQKGELCKWFLK
jgi:hypothetical protein